MHPRPGRISRRAAAEKSDAARTWHAEHFTSGHTHTPLQRPFFRVYPGSRYQKGKTNLDFTEATDSEWQWHQLDHMQVCTSLQTDNHTSTSPLSFLQAVCPSCHPTNSVKAEKATHLRTPSPLSPKTTTIVIPPRLVGRLWVKLHSVPPTVLSLQLNECVPIHLAQCLLTGPAISSAKILVCVFHITMYGSHFIKQHSETVMV